MKVKYVKINESRGYGNDPYLVVGEDDKHWHLKSEKTGEKFSIYKAHCTPVLKKTS